MGYDLFWKKEGGAVPHLVFLPTRELNLWLESISIYAIRAYGRLLSNKFLLSAVGVRPLFQDSLGLSPIGPPINFKT